MKLEKKKVEIEIVKEYISRHNKIAKKALEQAKYHLSNQEYRDMYVQKEKREEEVLNEAIAILYKTGVCNNIKKPSDEYHIYYMYNVYSDTYVGKANKDYFYVFKDNNEVVLKIYKPEVIIKSDDYGDNFKCTNFYESFVYVKGRHIKFSPDTRQFAAFNYWGEWGNTIAYKEFQSNVLNHLEESLKDDIYDSFDQKDAIDVVKSKK